jgi:predicted DNA-binding protein
MGQTISIRASEDMLRKLDDVASETDRSKSYHILKAIEYYIDEYADLQIALDRLNDATDPLISTNEMKESLGL